jgi:DNA repair protein RecN (Recombination protein N)
LHNRSLVTAIFTCGDGLKKLSNDIDAEVQNNEILVQKIISNEKSKQSIGGVFVNQKTLQNALLNEIVIHGQSDQLKLKSNDMQRNLIDSFHPNVLNSYQKTYFEIVELNEKLKSLISKEHQKDVQTKELNEQISEIDQIYNNGNAPNNNTYLELKENIEKAFSVDELKLTIENVLNNLSGSNNELMQSTISAKILNSINELNKFSSLKKYKELQNVNNQLADISYNLTDIINTLTTLKNEINAPFETIDDLQLKLNLFNKLMAKYGKTVDDVILWQKNAQKEVEKLNNFDNNVNAIKENIAQKNNELKMRAKELENARKNISNDISNKVTDLLAGLGFKNASLKIDIIRNSVFDRYGANTVNFLFSANSGVKLLDLSKTASGGELSRVMLAIETVINDKKNQTYIFDEIDAGIGGKTAFSVAKSLKNLSKNKQIIVITHLPQIAASADKHFVVQKIDDGKNTKSIIKDVFNNDRETEIIRMLGKTSDATLMHAKDLLNK